MSNDNIALWKPKYSDIYNSVLKKKVQRLSTLSFCSW